MGGIKGTTIIIDPVRVLRFVVPVIGIVLARPPSVITDKYGNPFQIESKLI